MVRLKGVRPPGNLLTGCRYSEPAIGVGAFVGMLLSSLELCLLDIFESLRLLNCEYCLGPKMFVATVGMSVASLPEAPTILNDEPPVVLFMMLRVLMLGSMLN
jgi:hypothetical protein